MGELGVSDDDVAIFREWLSKQPFLPQEDDYAIRCFIRVCKNSVQDAKIRYDNFFKTGCVLSTLMENWDPTSPDFKESYRASHHGAIQAGDTTYYYTKTTKEDNSKNNFDVNLMRIFAYVQFCMWEHNLTENFVYIYDSENSQISDLVGSPTFLEKLARSFTKSFAVRVKMNYVYKLPSFLELPAKIIQQVLSEKMKLRVAFTSDIETLKEKIPKEYLPSDYGGDAPSMSELNDILVKKHVGYRDKVLEDRSKRVAEAQLRPKDKDVELPGTFRQLAID